MTGTALFPRCSIVLTGQLRTPDRLLRSLDEWREMPEIDRVILVTWRDDARAAPDLVREIEARDVDLVVRPFPPVRGIGHVWPQTLALKVGLDRLDPDDLVLKTRADLRIEPTFLRSLVTTPWLLDAPGAVFGARIWVPWYELTKPFYLADECLLGRAGDLARLNNFDESYSLLHDIGCGVTHIRRFLHPFREVTDAFEPFLERWTDVGHFSHDRWSLLDDLLDEDEFVDLLAAYHAVLASCFRIASPDGAITFRDWSNGAPQPPLGDMREAFREERAAIPGGHLMAHSEAWLHAALRGELTGRLAERYAAAVHRAYEDGLPLTLPATPVPDWSPPVAVTETSPDAVPDVGAGGHPAPAVA